MKHEREQAAEILEDLMAVCRKHKCVLLPGNGVFYLARIQKELTAAEAQVALMAGRRIETEAIAQIREINPGMVVADYKEKEDEVN